jgi:hypothetical protein
MLKVEGDEVLPVVVDALPPSARAGAMARNSLVRSPALSPKRTCSVTSVNV